MSAAPLLLAVLLLLTACRSDMRDLENWRKETDRQTAPSAAATPAAALLPELPTAPDIAAPDVFAAAPAVCTRCAAPGAEIPPLRRLPLNRLSYVGYVRQSSGSTAYLQTADEVLAARPGALLGSEGGRLIRILPHELHLQLNGSLHTLPLARDKGSNEKPPPEHAQPAETAASARQE